MVAWAPEGCVEGVDPEVGCEKATSCDSTPEAAVAPDGCVEGLDPEVACEKGMSSESPRSTEKGTASEPSISSLDREPARAFKVSLVVRFGGIVMACCAGIVNAVAFKALGSFVSHQTGSFSKIGLGVEAGNAVLLVTSFVCGALLCGLLVSQNIVRTRVALYDVCLIIEAGLLVATTLLTEYTVARYLAAAACGLQNGLVTHWGGAVSRTTHVTGLFTDVGLLMGQLLSRLAKRCCGKKFDAHDRAAAADDLAKLSALGCIALAFLLGIIFGVLSYDVMGDYAFLIPAATVGSVGSVYLCYRVIGRRFFSDEEMEMGYKPRNSWRSASLRIPDGLQLHQVDGAQAQADASEEKCQEDAPVGSTVPASTPALSV